MIHYRRAGQIQLRSDSERAAKEASMAGLLDLARTQIARWYEVARIGEELRDLGTLELAELGLVRGDIRFVARGDYRRNE
jgi:hypothetical protein